MNAKTRTDEKPLAVDVIEHLRAAWERLDGTPSREVPEASRQEFLNSLAKARAEAMHSIVKAIARVRKAELYAVYLSSGPHAADSVPDVVDYYTVDDDCPF